MEKDKIRSSELAPDIDLAAADIFAAAELPLDPSCSAPFTLDYEAYAPYLEDSNMSEAQKREFLETLWSIIVSFVDLGFGAHPIQQACGEERAQAKNFAPDSPGMVGSEHQTPSINKSKAVDHDDM